MYTDLYDNGFKERNKGHFASIVKAAYLDGKISEKEQEFIDRLANRLDISEADYKQIMADPKSIPLNPPYLMEQRIQRLYDLARMVYIDYQSGPAQKDLLNKFVIGLGFSGNSQEVANHALAFLVLEYDPEEFAKKMEEFIENK